MTTMITKKPNAATLDHIMDRFQNGQQIIEVLFYTISNSKKLEKLNTKYEKL